MPTKRTRRTRNLIASRITEDAVAAFQAGDWLALHRALGLRPWEVSPLDDGDGCAPGSAGDASRAQAVELRDALIVAGAKMPSR